MILYLMLSALQMPNDNISMSQVYAIALYVEAERAARELGVRQRGGFFADQVDAD